MLTERYRELLHGVLSCYDRIVITGALPGVLRGGHDKLPIRQGDPDLRLPPLCRAVARSDPGAYAATGRGTGDSHFEYIAKAHIRQEEVVAKVLAARGDPPGLVRVISAMEACEYSGAFLFHLAEAASAVGQRVSGYAEGLRLISGLDGRPQHRCR
jgi:hypothetical protein